MTRAYRKWTAAEVMRAKGLRGQGLSVPQIARKLDRCERTVRRKLQGVYAPAQDYRARTEPGVALLECGASVADAAADVGMDVPSFCRSVRRHFGRNPGHIRREALRSRLARLLGMGVGLRNAAGTVGIPHTTAKRYALEAGFTYSHRAGWTRAMAAE